MKLIIQVFGKNSENFPDLLRNIAGQLEKGEINGSSLEENLCYDYLLEEESYHRKFMIYSNDRSLESSGRVTKENKVLGIAFGSCPHEAFENFTIKDKAVKNVVVREVLGNPVYKLIEDEEVS